MCLGACVCGHFAEVQAVSKPLCGLSPLMRAGEVVYKGKNAESCFCRNKKPHTVERATAAEVERGQTDDSLVQVKVALCLRRCQKGERSNN